MKNHTHSHTAELLQSAHSALAMAEFMSALSPSKYNYWNMEARHLRAAVERLQAEQSLPVASFECPTTPSKR